MAEIRFKDLDVDNMFDFCAVLDAIGVEQAITAFDKKEIEALQKAGKNINSIGVAIAMKVAGILIKNISTARDSICSFLAGCMEWDNGTPVTAAELRKFKISRFFKLIRDFCKKDDLVDFFKEVAELLDMEQPDLKKSATDNTATPTNI